MCQFDFPRDLHYWLKISSYQNNNHLTWVKSPSGAYGPIKVWIYPLNLNTTHCDGGEPELQCTLLHALPKVLCDVQWPHPPLCRCPVSKNCWSYKVKYEVKFTLYVMWPTLYHFYSVLLAVCCTEKVIHSPGPRFSLQSLGMKLGFLWENNYVGLFSAKVLLRQKAFTNINFFSHEKVIFLKSWLPYGTFIAIIIGFSIFQHTYTISMTILPPNKFVPSPIKWSCWWNQVSW